MAEMDKELLQLQAGLESLLDSTALSKHVAVAAKSNPLSHPATTLMHVRFLEDKADVHKLANFLWTCASNYALSRRRRQELRKEMLEAPEADLSSIGLISNTVRDAFIEFNKANPQRSSEVGELLAYCIAIEQLNAAQLLAKMAIKTNSNMPIHGLDGIHGKVENGCLNLYFLESKLSTSANSGVKEFANSVAEFTNNSKQYGREYQLVRDLGNLDALKPGDKKIALEYLDIFGSSDKQRRERYVGVILYSDQAAFDALPPVSDDQAPGFHEKTFAETLARQLEHHQTAAFKHLTAASGKPEKCRVFFVAVPDTAVVRELFYNAMGYVPPTPNIKASAKKTATSKRAVKTKKTVSTSKNVTTKKETT